MSDPTRPDVTEMVAVHRVFRNVFDSAPRLIGSVDDGDRSRAAIVASFYANVLEFLRVHHEGEDELMFPKLIERAEDPDLVRRIADEHHGVENKLAAANATAAEFAASGSAATGAQLILDLAALEETLVPHLDHEEAELLSVVERHITLEEWGELPGHAMGSFRGDNLFLILGLVREQMTPEQNERMFEEMPPEAVEAWKAVGLDAYKATVSALVGSPN